MLEPLGLDFGTTNSALAVNGPDGPRLARFSIGDTFTSTFRSILYFTPDHLDKRRRPIPFTGPQAIEQYLESDGGGRLIQSMKSYLPSHGFKATQVYTAVYTLEDLITFIVSDLRAAAIARFGEVGRKVVAGRPVHFARTEGGDDEFALGRLRNAILAAGFEEVIFEYEPVAAAYHYESGLDHDELVLIADFGGGTSDFCLIQAGPDARRKARTEERILATEGVGIAGDAFDSRIIRKVVAPRLGLGSEYRSVFSQKLQPMPSWIYGQLRRWHQLSFMKSRDNMKILNDIRDQAVHPDMIEGLIHLIEYDLGYHLYRAVEKTKLELSFQPESRFVFKEPPVVIDQMVTRAQFEGWIEDELQDIAACVDRTLAAAGAQASDVDVVFMTGGTSFVPAVRRIFEERFGVQRIRAGDELTSVARGLALRAADPDRS